MIDKSVIDPNALQFYRMLKEAGFSAYFVGGSVRDLLLGKEPKDFDIATNATPHQIKRIIPQGRIIGRRFRHVMLEKSGGRYEIVTFRGPVVHPEEDRAELEDEALANQPTEVADENGNVTAAPQTNPNGVDQRQAKRFPDLNQFGNAEQDALRRDFTINALFYDPDADELVDYVEGKLDIDRKLIRSIGDPLARMEEDPIRILRAIRHKMKLGLDYDPSLENAMREKGSLLEQTSKDRIREEFLKVCNDHSLGAFLSESKRLNLTPHIMPWFENVPDNLWDEGMRLWEKFKELPTSDRPSPDIGLALMMVPLIGPLVLEPYKQSVEPGEKNYLPDMKYFLSCETLRNYYLRNLRISRAQTDHVVRALFYYSRMVGLWLEQGPPRRIVGRLFQHPPAVLAAKMAALYLQLESKEIPSWLQDLADYDPSKRRNKHQRDASSGEGESRHDRDRNQNRHRYRDQDQEEGRSSDRHEQHAKDSSDEEAEDTSNSKTNRLPIPDQPMVWNGPLHAPVLRPTFAEEQVIRWARKNQTVRAYRPSGIPNQPVNHSFLKSNLVYNYKPEIDDSQARSEGSEEGGERQGKNRNRRDKRRGRDRDRGDRGERGDREQRQRGNESRGERHEHPARDLAQDPQTSDAAPPSEFDEDAIGNLRMPGEKPAALRDLPNETDYSDEEIDDNIGNRLDGPPTSGHVGINGEGFVNPNGHPQRNQGFRPRNGGGGGGQSNNNRRRRGKRRGRRGGGGPNRSGSRQHHESQ